jgi:hypothetical protein
MGVGENISDLTNKDLLKRFKRVRTKKRKTEFISEGIKRADRSDVDFLDQLLDPLFENKSSYEVVTNMILINNIIEEKRENVSSLLLNSEDLASLVNEIYVRSEIEAPNDMVSFNKGAFAISKYFSSASRLPEEYHESIIRNGYGSVFTIGDEDYDLFDVETDLSLALGVLAYKGDVERYISLMEHYIVNQNQSDNTIYLDPYEDYEEDDDDEFMDYGFDDDLIPESDSVLHEEIEFCKFPDLKRLAVMADYSRHNLYDFHRENVFPIGRAENMLYRKDVLERLLPLLNNH